MTQPAVVCSMGAQETVWRQSHSYTFAAAQSAEGQAAKAGAAACSPSYSFVPPLSVSHNSSQPPCAGDLASPAQRLPSDLVSPTSPLDSNQFLGSAASSVSSAASGFPALRTVPSWSQDTPLWGHCESPGRRSVTPTSRGSRRVPTIRKSASDAAASALELYKQELEGAGDDSLALQRSDLFGATTPWRRGSRSAQAGSLAELLSTADWGPPFGDSPRSVASKLHPLPEISTEAADDMAHHASSAAIGHKLDAMDAASAADIAIQLMPEQQASSAMSAAPDRTALDKSTASCQPSSSLHGHHRPVAAAASPANAQPPDLDAHSRQGEASTSYAPDPPISAFRAKRKARVSPEIVPDDSLTRPTGSWQAQQMTDWHGISMSFTGMDRTGCTPDAAFRPTPDVVAAFLRLAQAAFRSQPKQFAAVLQLVHDHSSGNLSVQPVAELAVLLLKDHPELLQRYNAFMPPHITLETKGLRKTSRKKRSPPSQKQKQQQRSQCMPDSTSKPARPKGGRNEAAVAAQASKASSHRAHKGTAVTDGSQLRGAGQLKKGRKYMLVMRNLNTKQFRGVARNLRRDGVRIGSILSFADWLAPPANVSYLPWCTTAFTVTMLSLFFFMAGGFGLYLATTTTAISSEEQQQAASEVANNDAVTLSSPHGLWAWLSFRPGWRVFTFDYLLAWGGRYGPAIADGQWYRWGTSVLVHSSFQHLLANLLLLVALAGLLEASYGSWRIGAVWLISALGAAFTSATFEPACTLVVGASGSVFGFMGLTVADLALNYRSLSHPALRLAFTLATLVFFVVTSVTKGSNSYVSNWSHAGGFICGLFPSFLFLPNLKDRRWRAARKLAVRVGILRDTRRPAAPLSVQPVRSTHSVRLHPRVVASITASRRQSGTGPRHRLLSLQHLSGVHASNAVAAARPGSSRGGEQAVAAHPQPASAASKQSKPISPLPCTPGGVRSSAGSLPPRPISRAGRTPSSAARPSSRAGRPSGSVSGVQLPAPAASVSTSGGAGSGLLRPAKENQSAHQSLAPLARSQGLRGNLAVQGSKDGEEQQGGQQCAALMPRAALRDLQPSVPLPLASEPHILVTMHPEAQCQQPPAACSHAGPLSAGNTAGGQPGRQPSLSASAQLQTSRQQLLSPSERGAAAASVTQSVRARGESRRRKHHRLTHGRCRRRFASMRSGLRGWSWPHLVCMLLGVAVMAGVFVAMPLYLYLDKLRDLHC